jgi:hypothetical protein
VMSAAARSDVHSCVIGRYSRPNIEGNEDSSLCSYPHTVHEERVILSETAGSERAM